MFVTSTSLHRIVPDFPDPSHPHYATAIVDDCLTTAIARSASDIHFQPRRDVWDVSFRRDGVLQSYRCFAKSDGSDPVARLMAMAGMPSYLGGVPQEAPLRFESSGEPTEMRLAIFPTVFGNRAALRIMEPATRLRELNHLGLDEATLSSLKKFCGGTEGWLLVAGPAGSGKTTTLYACLSHIAGAQPRRSVLTIEDPIESILESISQSQLQPASGLTLASAMKSAVRQDSEVLLVSEIRDAETAEAVLAASMTGHLCFSSIHSGSIGSTLRRLVQMRLPIFAMQSGLRAVLCQRLLRRTCDVCRGDDSTNCLACGGTGYRGRFPIAQMVMLDESPLGPSLFDALADHQPAAALDALIESVAIDSLGEQAKQLVASEMTDRNEVFRVLGHVQ